ncbi:hypothetical protein N0V90_008163 [Kalmusia sp. IMI 367209]|nr:hypothetical protein N0V90_008163 [Kalmusia sp. IMI 367209]
MDTSRYFERTLFYDRSPAADEYYVRSAGSIFENNPERSKIEVKIQTSIDISYYDQQGKKASENDFTPKLEGKGELCEYTDCSPVHEESKGRTGPPKFPPSGKGNGTLEGTSVIREYDTDSDDCWSLSSKASSTALPAALDHHQGSEPPTYPGPPKLRTVDLDPKLLGSFAKATKNNFRVFYLRQRHSYSRLQITQDVFEQLLKICHAFPRFNEYMIGFGVKTGEVEVGPPPLKYKLALDTGLTKQSDKAAGISIEGLEIEGDIVSIEVEDHQELKLIEDRIADLILCLESTLDTVSTFEEMYEHFCDHSDQGSDMKVEYLHRDVLHADTVARALRDKKKEITYTRKKAETLLLKVQNARALVW